MGYKWGLFGAWGLGLLLEGMGFFPGHLVKNFPKRGAFIFEKAPTKTSGGEILKFRPH